MASASSISLNRVMIASFIMLSAFCYLTFFSKSEDIPPKKELSAFPKTIDAWTGSLEFFNPEVYNVLGVDDSVLINYSSRDAKTVQLYVGYYESQREGDLIHSPKNCLPGSGWLITRTSSEKLSLSENKLQNIDVNKLLLEKGEEKQMVLYWFQSHGRFISSEYMQKIYMVWDSLTQNRTDQAFVRLVAPIGPGGEQFTKNYLIEFAEKIIPILSEYLPN